MHREEGEGEERAERQERLPVVAGHYNVCSLVVVVGGGPITQPGNKKAQHSSPGCSFATA